MAPQATIFRGLASHRINLLEILEARWTDVRRFGDDWERPGAISWRFLGLGSGVRHCFAKKVRFFMVLVAAVLVFTIQVGAHLFTRDLNYNIIRGP